MFQSLILTLWCACTCLYTCRLTEEERHTLQLSPQEDSENTEVRSAVEFGEFVRGGGDEVHALIQRIRRDPQVRDFADDAARDEDPSQAIQTFVDVAMIVFEVGDGGIGKPLNLTWLLHNYTAVMTQALLLANVYPRE